MRVILFALACLCLVPSGRATDFNAHVLRAIRAMPEGGGYSVNAGAAAKLRASMAVQHGILQVNPSDVTPSYCSGATYLVFLMAIRQAIDEGAAAPGPAALEAMLVRGQGDGAGVWGRWNANGPGTARLFHETGLGRNFTDFDQARPGDFLKVFWTEAIGRAERGHSVIFLGMETRDGQPHVRFWSSNQKEGYGEKSVPLSRVRHALFSRLENAAAVERLDTLPKRDVYLAEMLTRDSSRGEMLSRCGAR